MDNPMKPGQFVIVHLIDPTERIWGQLLDLQTSGCTIRGIDVKQIETFKYQFNRKDRLVFPQTFFFPMRRIQKIDLDESIDNLPSVIASIEATTGLSAQEIIAS